MNWKTIRNALLAGLAVGCMTVAAQADSSAPEPVPLPKAPPTPAPAAPAMTQKVLVTICVPEQYEATRMVCKTEWKEEKYTAIKCELVPVEKTRMVTYCTNVPVDKVVDVVRRECYPVVENKVVTKYVTRCVPVEKIVSKVVDQGGHYECREVPCPERHGLLFHLCHRECEDPCAPPPTKLVSVYVPNCVTVQEKVTCLQRTCVPVTETVPCTVYKTRDVKEQVTVHTCEIKTEVKEQKYTCMEEKRTPYEATRKVAYTVMVPEKVTCTRMVTKQVEREVPVCVPTPCYEASCETACTHSCGHARCGGGLFRRGCR
jgi:hypothetical protein